MRRPMIPRHLGALTTEWLDAALRDGGLVAGPRIESFKVEKIGEGQGFMGETARLHLAYESPGTHPLASVIVKIPTENRKLRAVGESMGLYEREILFYTQLAQRLPVRLPRCYVAQMDPRPLGKPEQDALGIALLERLPRWVLILLIRLAPWVVRLSRRRYVLILEDLGAARLGNQVTETPDADIHAALASLARIHAECWDDPAVKGLAWLHPLDSTAKIFGSLLVRQRRGFEELFGGYMPDGAPAILDWLEVHLGAIHQKLARSPCTLLHGDYRLDNLFFDDTSNDGLAIVADWQIPSWGRGACDLAYFLSGTLDASLPVDAAFPYVETYHATLRDLCGDDYSLEECKRDYVLGLLFVIGRVVSSFAEIEPTNERAVMLFRLWVERAFARLRGVDLGRVLEDPASEDA